MKSEAQSEQAYWQEISDEWLSSKLSQKAFCQERGISYVKLVYWRSKLIARGLAKRTGGKEKVSKSTASGFIQLVSTGSATYSKQYVELMLPHGIVLRVPLDAVR